jgi:hypothetical protein
MMSRQPSLVAPERHYAPVAVCFIRIHKDKRPARQTTADSGVYPYGIWSSCRRAPPIYGALPGILRLLVLFAI